MSQINTKGFFVGAAIIIAGIGLFFIPEIVQLQEMFFGGTTASTTAAKPTAAQVAKDLPVEEVAQVQEISALDRVLVKLQTGAYEPKPTPSVGLSSQVSQAGMTAGQKTVANEAEARLREREMVRLLIQKNPMTWQLIGRPEMQRMIQRAYKDAQTLVKLFNSERPRSRAALVAYMASISPLARGDIRSVEPEVVLKNVAQADIQVTEAFQVERVKGAELRIWKLVSLGPLTERYGSDRLKEQYNPPFRDTVVLTSVEITDPPPPAVRYVRGSPVMSKATRKISTLKVKALIVGAEAVRAQILRQGYVVKEFRLPKIKGQSARRAIQFEGGPYGARGVIGVRLISADGEINDKFYSFLTQAQKQLRADKRGRYETPKIEFAAGADIGPINPRLDKVFAIAGSGGDDGFSSSNGDMTGLDGGVQGFDAF